MLLIAEVFRNRQARQSDAQARPWRFSHLSVNQRCARFLRIARDDNSGFGHFQPKVISFARSLADAGKHRQPAVLQRYVVNQLQNEDGLANSRASEESDLSALHVRFDEINYLDPRLEHFQRGGLILKGRRRAVNRIVGVRDDRAELIDWFAEHIHHPAKRGPAHGNFNPFSQIVGLHAANHALDRLHRDRADASFAEVLLDLRRHVEWFRHRVAFARDAASVVDGWQMPRLKLNVHHRSDDLYHASHACVFLCHAAFS